MILSWVRFSHKFLRRSTSMAKKRMKWKLFSIFLVFLMSLILPCTALAIECCEEIDTTPGSIPKTWTCTIDGQPYECTGDCPGVRYNYQCNPPPCDNCHAMVLIWEFTGPCTSRDPTCDGWGLCSLTLSDSWGYCDLICECD